MAIIFILSFIPVNKIKAGVKRTFGITDTVKVKIKRMVPNYMTPTNIQNILHVPFFGFLAYLWMRFFKKRNTELKKAVISTIAITFAFSLVSEGLQIFTPARDISLSDLVLDAIGSVGGIFFARVKLFGAYAQ